MSTLQQLPYPRRTPQQVEEFRCSLHKCPIHHWKLIPLRNADGTQRTYRIGNIEYDEFDCPMCLLTWRINAHPVPAELGGNATQAVSFTPEGVR